MALRSLLEGFRTIAHEPRLRLLIGLYDAQCFVAGALGVLIVATAIDLLGIGNAGVGVLQSACGVGAIAGAGVALIVSSLTAGPRPLHWVSSSGACRSSSSAHSPTRSSR